jgi:tripartite ATP-independent transporter DctM subunit
MTAFLPIIIALVLYFTGIPIAYALLAGTLYFFGFVDTTSHAYLLLQKFITATQSFPFLAIPFFIMCGSIMNYSGMSGKLMAFADALTGHLKGGLAQINVLLSMLMGGCSGSANADAAMECKMLVPEMEKRGYGKGFSAAITAASSCITPIIPPGINLIVYGLIAGASVGKLFAAGYLPGLLMAIVLMIAVSIIANKRGYAPSREKRASGGEIARQALDSLWALLFPFGIIMGMRFGLFTPTEAGGVGVLYCFLVGKFVYKGLKKEHFIPIFKETVAGTCTVMLIIVAATLFGYYLNWEQIPSMLVQAVSGLASNKYLVLLLLNVVLLIAGMFLEGGAALIILAPLMVPLVKAAGIDLIHFGIVVNVNIMIGGLTPPFGSMMFTCVAITKCKMSEFIREVMPFIIALIAALLLITYIEPISTLIPNLIYGT